MIRRVAYVELSEREAQFFDSMRRLEGCTTPNLIRRALFTLADEMGLEAAGVFVERQRLGRPAGPLIHGTLNGYKDKHCRCALCRQANANYHRQWKRAKATA